MEFKDNEWHKVGQEGRNYGQTDFPASGVTADLPPTFSPCDVKQAIWLLYSLPCLSLSARFPMVDCLDSQDSTSGTH